jgi:glucuronoarabinoxylan endo-1,4-beta-xylanase
MRVFSKTFPQKIALALLIPVLVIAFDGCAGLVSGNGSTGTPPQNSLSISSVQASSPTSSGFQVNWLTNAPATSKIEYGTTVAYGSSTLASPNDVTLHQMALTGLAAGTLYHYRVHSTDSQNVDAVSGDFTFSTSAAKNTTPPTVQIVSPLAGATLSGIANVSATASDSVGVSGVQFKVDGANVGPNLLTAPYIYALNTNSIANGSHGLTAVATDEAGNTATSSAVAFLVSNAVAPPVVSISTPANGSTVSGTATVTANATSSIGVASVQFQLDGANVGSPVTVAPYSYLWDTTKSSNGSHTLKAVATDTAGNSATSTGDTVTVSNAVAPPVVSISTPANGSTVSGIIAISGMASSSLSVSLVQVSVDGGGFSNASGTNNWTLTLDTASLTNASHSLTAKAIDSAGNSGLSNSVTITVNNPSGSTVTVNWSDVQQVIDGFGASSAATGDGISDTQADLLWSTTNGVGLSLLRVQIESNGTYPDLATMQKAKDRRVTIWGTPWSPPASMKTNGSLENGGSLLASDYQAYADYLSSYVLGLKNYGIDLYALSIQNEPNYTATWQSCIWTGQQFHDFLANNLLPTFAKNGMTTKIIMPEETGWFFSLATTTLNDPATAAGVSIIAAHNYDGASASPYPLGQGQGKKLWETEVSTFDAFDPSIGNGLIWAQKINDWMTIANANAWHYWWLVGATDNESLIGANGETTKRLYVMGNFSKFVRPGYYRIGTSGSPVTGVSVSAYKDPGTGKFAIVALNHNGSPVTLEFQLNGFVANTMTPWVTSASLNLAQQPSITVGGSSFAVTLPATSVTTLVGP